MLALGIVSLLWAGLMVVYAVMHGMGMLEQMLDRMDTPPELMGPAFVALAILSAVTGSLQVAAGVALLRKRLAARGLGLAAAILSLCSVWTCCVWLFAIGFGIYALMVLVPNRPA